MNTLLKGIPSLEIIKKIVQTRKEPLWLVKQRKEAFKTYQELETPQLRYGTTILFSLHNFKLDNVELNSDVQPMSINNPNPHKVIIVDLHQALHEEKYQNIIKQHLFKTINLSIDTHNYLEDDKSTWLKFNYFHVSFFIRGVFVYIPRNANIQEPIYLDFSTLNRTQLDHTLIIAEEGSTATIIFTNSVQNNEEQLKTNYLEVFVKENAGIKIIKTQNYAKNVYNFEQNNAVINNDASIEWYVGVFGSSYIKADTKTELLGKGSSCTMHGLFLGSDQQQFDLNTEIIHRGDHTHSEIIARGAVKDKAKALFRGLVHMKEHAFQSQGQQKEDLLILNKGAEADAIPKLLINQNDVKCNHGTSIGQVDKEKLFYAMSRGISEEKAKHMIVEGFFSPVLEHFPQKNIADKIKEIIHQEIVAGE